MTTPNDAQDSINTNIRPGVPGGITAVSLAATLTTIVAVFALYAPLASPTFSGVVTTPEIVIGAGSAVTSSGPGGALGTAAYTATSAYEVPLTFSTGLTRTTNTVTVNTSQNIATLSNLATNGFVTTSGGAGALGVTALGSGVTTALGLGVNTTGGVVTVDGAWTAYTPVATCSSGSVTTFAALAGRYRLSGKTAFIQINASITTVGTCSGVLFLSLPIAAGTVGSGVVYPLSGVDATTSLVITQAVSGFSTNATISFSSAPAAHNYYINGTYEVL